jgi:hypothetical protein
MEEEHPEALNTEDGQLPVSEKPHCAYGIDYKVECKVFVIRSLCRTRRMNCGKFCVLRSILQLYETTPILSGAVEGFVNIWKKDFFTFWFSISKICKIVWCSV